LDIFNLGLEEIGDWDMGLPDLLFISVEWRVVKVNDCVATKKVAQHALLAIVDMIVYFCEESVEIFLVLCIIVDNIGCFLCYN
jgi:hypothetical protein